MLQATGMEIVGRRIIPDEKEMIRLALIEWSDGEKSRPDPDDGRHRRQPPGCHAGCHPGGHRTGDPGDGGGDAPSERWPSPPMR